MNTVFSRGYLCELQQLSPLSTGVAVDSCEAGSWASPPGSKGSSLIYTIPPYLKKLTVPNVG